uniref:Uncharacterized protein n=1 Tax=Panagrellus redivivus TaxID=6233 RepID=A0A7E4W638_PANRE
MQTHGIHRLVCRRPHPPRHFDDPSLASENVPPDNSRTLGWTPDMVVLGGTGASSLAISTVASFGSEVGKCHCRKFRLMLL